MGADLLPEVLIRQLGTAASRLSTAIRSADGAAEIGLLQALGDELISSYSRAARIAPESTHGVSADTAEQLTSAIRGVQELRTGGDLDASARLATLVDAAQGFSAEALRSMPNVRPVRVVVGGGGPGGLATANLLRKIGADVTVAHPGATDWRTGILIEQRAWDILRQAGGEDLLRTAPVDDAGTSIMAPLSLVDSTLSAHARQLGVDVLDTHRVRSATNLDGGTVVSIQDDATGIVRNAEADWYVDATGGASPVAHQAAFRRRMFEGTFDALPQKRLFMRQSARSVDSAPIGWNGPDDAFVLNDKLADTLMVYRPVPNLVRGHTLSAEEGLKLLDSVGVDRESAIGAPAAVMARQRLAPAAAAGRVLMVGDSVGSVMPVTQAGVLLALLDARRAVDMIAASRGEMTSVADDAVRALDDLVRDGAVVSDDAVRELGIQASTAADSAVEALVSSYGDETVITHRLFLA